MAASKKPVKPAKSKSTTTKSKSKERHASAVAFGDQDLGQTFAGLLDEFGGAWGSDLFSLVGTAKLQDAPVIDYCLANHGIALIGRSHHGLCFFGIAPKDDERPVDQRPVILVDNKGTGPETAAKNLADYLSLCAYSSTWADTPKEWAARRKEDLGEKAFAALGKRLLGIAGVALPKEPWRLQKGLPAFTPPRSEEDTLRALFGSAVAKLDMLLLWDGVEDGSTISVMVDGPPELEEILPHHPVVVEPLKAFVGSLRTTFPNRKFRVGISYDTLRRDGMSAAESAKASWKRLEMALRSAGKASIYEELTSERSL